MQTDNNNLPSDVVSCHQVITELSSKLTELSAQLQKQASQFTELDAEYQKLRKLLARLVNGNRSEKRILSSDSQTLLPFESDEEFQAAKLEAQAEAQQVIERYEVKRHVRKSKPRDESLPKDLPRVEIEVKVDEAIKTCEQHGERKQINEDIIETLVIVPPRAYVEVRRYPKFVCPANRACGIASPERPTGLVQGNRYSPSVAAAVIDYKWGQYLPIYRQQDLFAASGWTPHRSTLLNLVNSVEFVIDPFITYMTRKVQADIGVGIDDTSCRMLLPKDLPKLDLKNLKSVRLVEKIKEARRKGDKSVLAKMWVYSGLHYAPYNIFDFRVSRHRDGPEDFFGQSQNCKVQGDCFSGNTSVVLHSDERLKFVACWAHARRKVVDSQTYADLSKSLLGMIQALYQVESRGVQMTAPERQALRQRESAVILASIGKWLDSPLVADVLPKSDFAEAVRYIRNHWTALGVYVSDGRMPIDNNRVEQLMKQVALGRKAWLFVSNVSSGERSAKMMSLVSSARRHDLDVRAYVEDILEQLLFGVTDYASLLPDAWAKSHPHHIRVYRQEERRDKADRQSAAAARRLLAQHLKT